MLRDPVERAWSQYLQGLGNGAIRWNFRDHIRRNLQHRSKQLCVHYPFLEFGLYSEQLQRSKTRFGSNVWVGFYDEFKQRPRDVLRDICHFLGLEQEFSPTMDHRHMEAQVPRLGLVGWLKRSGIWRTTAKLTPSGLRPLFRRALVRKPGTTHMDPADRAYLIDFYREDILQLSRVLGRNLDAWLQPEAPESVSQTLRD